jgi:hypothetical protein
MYIISNKQGQAIAKLSNNILFDLEMNEVIGIVIGNCFFGSTGEIVGKIFNDTVYLTKGDIIGKLALDGQFKNKSLKKEHMVKAWTILSCIKDHTIPWIKESKRWDNRSLTECLGVRR